MANNSRDQLIADARRWVEQEKAWEDVLYATAASPATTPVVASSPGGRGVPEHARKSEIVLPSTIRRGVGVR